MANTRVRDLTVIACSLAALIWVLIPPDSVAFNESCEPAGGPASLSAAVFSSWFWGKQLDAAIAERNNLLTQPARRARADAELMREVSNVEGRMVRLSREEMMINDRAERERVEAAEQSRRLKKVAGLMQCEAEIRQRLGR